MISDESFDIVQKLCEKYQNDNKYVFKACNNFCNIYDVRDWLVVMEKCDDTKTNEGRNDVSDAKHAKFRASKLKVIDIINKTHGGKIDHVINVTDFGKTLMYKVGKIVECDDYDDDLDIVCSRGIHYFKTMITAYYYGSLPSEKHTCKMIEWNCDGSKRFEKSYKNDLKDGLWTEWYDNGQKQREGTFKNDEKDGLWTEWYNNGQKCTEVTYINGNKSKTYMAWGPDGQIVSEFEKLFTIACENNNWNWM